ncbi:hypothetical protein GJ496_001395 [Pomphorhynchus laevis]|nr:hypothetical protein GJ496_001395 [Pomphorhynchus laevis]
MNIKPYKKTSFSTLMKFVIIGDSSLLILVFGQILEDFNVINWTKCSTNWLLAFLNIERIVFILCLSLYELKISTWRRFASIMIQINTGFTGWRVIIKQILNFLLLYGLSYTILVQTWNKTISNRNLCVQTWNRAISNRNLQSSNLKQNNKQSYLTKIELGAEQSVIVSYKDRTWNRAISNRNLQSSNLEQ